jgi:hypothetical protein
MFNLNVVAPRFRKSGVRDAQADKFAGDRSVAVGRIKIDQR